MTVDADSTAIRTDAVVPKPPRRVGRYEFQIAALVIASIALMALLWAAAGVLLLVFASLLLAILIRTLAALFERVAPLPDKVAVLLSVLVIAAILAVFFLLLGRELWAQGLTLAERGPALIQGLGDRLGVADLDGLVSGRIGDILQGGTLLRSTAGYSVTAAGAVTSLVLVLFGAIYFALEPGLYRKGICLLAPRSARRETDQVLLSIGEAVRLWLVGQLVSMFIVGILTTLGLWWLGVDSAIVLGFLTGVLDFVPMVGPVVAAIPAILVGLSEDPWTAVWVALLFLAVQQVESTLITPLVQRRTMMLPPALTVFTIIAFGTLFGTLGALLAAPLTAATYVAVGRIWVRDVIGQDVTLPTA